MEEPQPPKKVKEQPIQVYQGAKRIHPKLAKGRFANIRIIMILATQLFFYGVPWINWDGRQAVWFDVLGRHFYIFSLVFEPADLLYLTGLLIVSAFGLFWWTTVAGRLWCGYSCPQTVYTEIMLWIDHFVEGDRNKRLKLDKEPWNFRKIRIKALKYLLIFIVAAWTGITFAGWFTPIREFVPAIFNGTAGHIALGTAAFYGFVTWLFGHIMREQVCLHMCPYARFQSAMFDHDTLVISYDEERGEPRGARKKTAERGEGGIGDCINCTMCVQVCPVGIDIRDGLQYQCIGCAACIDACDEVMDKMGYPRGLIRYTTEAVLKHEYTDQDIKKRLLRPKVVGYGGVLLAAGSLGSGSGSRSLDAERILDSLRQVESAATHSEEHTRLEDVSTAVGFTNLVDSRGDLRTDRSHELFLLLLDLFLHHLIAILRARLHLLELLLTALLDDVGHRGFFLLISFELHLQLILHTLDLSVILLSEILDLRSSSLDIGQGFHDGGGVDDPDLLLSVSRECQREHQEEGNEELLHCLGLLRLIS